MGYSAPAFGIQSTGFVKKLVTDVQLDIKSQAQGPSGVDPNLDLSPTEPMGQVLGIAANEIAECWEVLETLYNSLDPNSAEDFLLDAICALTGTKRSGATYSYVIATLNLNATTTINAGTVANVNGQPANQWTLIGPGDPTTGLLLSLGPVVSTTSGNYYGYFRATTTGPNIANSGTLTVVASPPTGLNSITNAADAIVGTLKQTDAQLRATRQIELAAAGSGTLDAIRAAVLEVPGVGTVFVYENTTNTTDGFGRPAHSVEVVVFDGVTPAASNNAIAQALWNNKPAGTPYYSATGDSGTATDSQGNPQTVVFSRATVTPIYVTATTTPAATALTAPGIKAGWAAWGLANVGLGAELYALAFRAAVLPNAGETNPYAIEGLVDVPTFAFDVTPSPTNTGNLAATTRQFFYISTAHMTVNGF